MKKILFFILITFNSFGFDCELNNSKFNQNKSVTKSYNLSFESVIDSGDSVYEYILESGNKLQIHYKLVKDELTGFNQFFVDLDLLSHRGGNGYITMSSLRAKSLIINNGIIKFDLSKIFGDRSESLNYQSSERIDLQNYILKCSIL